MITRETKGFSLRTALLNKSVALKVALTAIVILIYPGLRKQYDTLVVDSFLSAIQSTWWSDLAFSMFAFSIFILLVKGFYRHRAPRGVALLATVFISQYVYFRFISTEYIFLGFSFCPVVKYSDILLLGVTIPISFLLKRSKDLDETSDGGFVSDEPLGNSNDLLGYERYARHVARQIINTSSTRSVSVGINGEWGFGKTSFIDLIKRETKPLCRAENLKIIEYDFNPWNSSSSTAVVKDFFDGLRDLLNEYHVPISSLIRDYSVKLINLNEKSYYFSILALFVDPFRPKSVSEMQRAINDALNAIHCKIIVYIDDLDRLDKYEIVEVIRLVRNTANFNNTVFVAAYNRDYVNAALKELNTHGNEQFLEKIFQIEITLPHFDNFKVRKLLHLKLCSAFPKEYHETFEAELLGTASANPKYLSRWIRSIRDVNRIYNSLLANLPRLLGEVDFGDLLMVELIRFKYPSVYDCLYRDTETYLIAQRKQNSENIFVYTLRREGDSKEEAIKRNTGEPVIKKVLSSYSSHDTEKILQLLTILFDDKRYSYYNKSDLSIVYPNKFYRYFAYDLLDDDLSEVLFARYRDGDLDNFYEKIREWVSLGLQDELIQRFKQISEFNHREDFEKVISAILFLGRLESKRQEPYYSKYVEYDYRDLAKKLYNYDGRITKRFYPGENGANDLKAFIRQLFMRYTPPFEYEADIIRHLNFEFHEKLDDEYYVLSTNEYLKIVHHYLRTYLSSVTKFDPTIWTLFHCCRHKVYTKSNVDSYNVEEKYAEESKLLLRDFAINVDFDGFIDSIIEQPPAKTGFAVSVAVLYVFDGWDTFKAIIGEMPPGKWRCLEEFKHFYNLFEQNEPRVYIKYDFKVIKPN